MKRSVPSTYYRQAIKKILFLLIACLFSGALDHISLTLATPQHTESHYYRLPGVIVPLLLSHTPNSVTAPSKVLQLSVHLSIRNRTFLDTLLTMQADPNSPFYHHYLTPQTFKSQFGPTEDTIEDVITFLQSHHLTITSIASNNLVIHASASVATIEKTFLIMLHNYVIDGHTIYAPSLNPAIPDHLVSSLQNIVGLDNISVYKPRYRIQKGISSPSAQPTGYTPNDIRTAYDINPLLKMGADGTGQTVALFELDGYTPADIDTYLNYYKLGPKKYSDVLIDGAINMPGSSAIETTLDMEMMSAIAPNATQKVYIGPNSTVGVNDIYNAIVNDDSAKIVSISWGQCEVATGNAEIETLHDIFQQGAAQGQTFFAASGDAGAYDCGDMSLSVDSPANQPNVVGVGGTTLILNKDSTYRSESAWSSTSDSQLSGGGGGLSFYFPRPAYQTDPHVTSSQRMVPDVSANANPATGYSIYCSRPLDVCSRWSMVGGTSAAAPLWAAIAADINHYLFAQKKMPLGYLNPTLYTLYNKLQRYPAYHDVTTGDNRFYKATIGYDLATGIGTPDAWNLARDLAMPALIPTKEQPLP